jgi:hypothetical protein
MLPDVYAVFFAGNAEPRPEEELRAQPRGETPVIHEEVLPTIPENPALGSERTYYNQKVCAHHCRGCSHDAQSQ